METAEALFTREGIEAVSLRRIALAVGQANNNAVQYHFGSKEGLITAIFSYRVAQMDPRRRAMLQAAEREGATGSLDRLLDILCLPILDIVDENGRHSYAGFLAQYLLRYQMLGIPHPNDLETEDTWATFRTIELLRQRIWYVPEPAASSRIALTHLMFLSMVVRADDDARMVGRPDFRELVMKDVRKMMVSALTCDH